MFPENHDTQRPDDDSARQTALSARPTFRSACLLPGVPTCTWKYARVVPATEIEQNDGNLNISRYMDTSEAVERIDVAEAVRKLRELERERAAAEATINRYLTELGYE